jgi:hypothetical protein
MLDDQNRKKALKKIDLEVEEFEEKQNLSRSFIKQMKTSQKKVEATLNKIQRNGFEVDHNFINAKINTAVSKKTNEIIEKFSIKTDEMNASFIELKRENIQLKKDIGILARTMQNLKDDLKRVVLKPVEKPIKQKFYSEDIPLKESEFDENYMKLVESKKLKHKEYRNRIVKTPADIMRKQMFIVDFFDSNSKIPLLKTGRPIITEKHTRAEILKKVNDFYPDAEYRDVYIDRKDSGRLRCIYDWCWENPVYPITWKTKFNLVMEELMINHMIEKHSIHPTELIKVVKKIRNPFIELL